MPPSAATASKATPVRGSSPTRTRTERWAPAAASGVRRTGRAAKLGADQGADPLRALAAGERAAELGPREEARRRGSGPGRGRP